MVMNHGGTNKGIAIDVPVISNKRTNRKPIVISFAQTSVATSCNPKRRVAYSRFQALTIVQTNSYELLNATDVVNPFVSCATVYGVTNKKTSYANRVTNMAHAGNVVCL